MLIPKSLRKFLPVLFLVSFHLAQAQFSVQNVGMSGSEFVVTNAHPTAMWGDFDNDGDLDLARVMEGTPKVNRNDLSSFTTFSLNMDPHGNGYCGGVWADMNNDGFLDLLYTSYGTGATPLYMNNGNSTFTLVKSFGRVRYGNLDVADIDLDGDLDVIACGMNWNLSGTDHGTKIFRNDGGWVFTQVYQSSGVTNVFGDAGNRGGTVRFADFTNDGYPDIVLSGSNNSSNLTPGSGHTEVWRNTGSGFVLMYSGIAVVNGRIDIGDVNSDGWMDFAVTGALDGPWTSNGQVYTNNGNGTFTSTAVAGRTDGSIFFGDYDNDGDLDLDILGTSGSSINQIYNNSGGSFTVTSQIPNPANALSNGTSIFGDYDNDGKLDLLAMGSNSGTSYLALLKNGFTGTANTAPLVPTALNAVVTNQDVSLSWNASSDGQTPSAGLTYNVMVGQGANQISLVTPNSNPSNGYRRVPKAGNAWSNKFFNLKNLAPGTYTWSVQAIDNSYAGSAFATSGSFTIPPPAPTVTASINYCVGNTASQLSATGMSGATFKWYTGTGTLIGTTGPTPSTATAGTTIYKVSQVVNGIEGAQSTITVVVNSIPGLPTVTDVGYCIGVGASPLTATAGGTATLNWYGTNATGGTASGTAPTPSTATAGTTSYYVSQTNLGCEGSRAAIVVTVYNYPAGPTVSPVSYCLNAAASPLTATPTTGGTLSWYGTNSSGGTASGTAPTPSTTAGGVTIYYVSQTVNACEGPRSAITVTINTPPTITTQPSSSTVCSGAATTFSVSASGTALVYQWLVSTDGGTTFNTIANGGAYSNATTATLNITSNTGLNNYKYKCQIAGSCSPIVVSNAVSLTVNALPSISADPIDRIICNGGTAPFSVTASGTGLTYQWQVSTNSGSSYSNLSDGGSYTGTTTSFMVVNAAPSGFNNYFYRCIVSGTCTPSVTSAIAILTVNNPPSFITMPGNATICSGGNATFSTSIIGTAPISYTWSESSDGVTFNTISNGGIFSGATTGNLTLTGAGAGKDNYYYKCTASNMCSPGVVSTSAGLRVNIAPSITVQPTNVTICAGVNTSFSVSATGTSLTYQWKVSTDGGTTFSNITDGALYSNTTTSTVTVNSASGSMNGYIYRCLVSGICSPAATTSNAILTVNTAPAVTGQPSAASVCNGGNTSYNVTATGTGLFYSWYVSPDGGTTYNLISDGGVYSNATTSTLNITGAGLSMNGYLYRATIVGTCTPGATSGQAALTVNTAPSITTQPIPSTVCAGTNTSFTVAATGTSLAYQWMVSTDGGTTFNAVTNGGIYSNAQTATLDITSPAATANGNKYRCQISGVCTPSVISNTVTLTINTAPSVSSNPANTTICSGGNTSFSVTATGTGLTYQWQVSTNGGSTYTNLANTGIYSNVTSSTLVLTAATTAVAGNYYRCQISGTCPSPVNSVAGILNINTSPSITTQPVASTTCENTATTFTVAATGTNLTYQWQVSTDGGSNFNNVAVGIYYNNPTTNGLNLSNVPPSFNGNIYRCLIAGTCSPAVTTNQVSLVVNTYPVINTQPSPATVCQSSNTSFNITASGTGLTYKWQESINGTTYNDLSNTGIFSGVNTSTLLLAGVPNGKNGMYYRCVVGGTCNIPVNSNGVTLTVNMPPAVTTGPLDKTICEGNTVNFSVSATGTGLLYQWQESTDGITFNNLSNGGNYSNTNNAVLTISNVPANYLNYFYRCQISGACTPSVTSGNAMLTVNTSPVINLQPVNSTVCEGVATSFRVNATGANITYQWQGSTDGVSYFNISDGAVYSNTNSGVLSVNNPAPGLNGFHYRCLLNGSCSPAVTSSDALLTVNTPPTLVQNPFNNAACEGSGLVMTSQYSGTGLTYQWQVSSDGITFNNISNVGIYSNADTKNLTINNITAAEDGSWYRVVVNGVCSPSHTSAAAKVTVNRLPAITSNPADSTICNFSSTGFTVGASGTGLNYSWEVSTNNGSTFTPINNGGGYSNANTSTLNITAASNTLDGYLYRCRVNGVCTLAVNSSPAKLAFNPNPSISTQPSPLQACNGSNGSFTVVSSGSGWNYKWEVSINGSTYNPITDNSTYANSSTPTLNINGVNPNLNGYYYRCVISGLCNSVTSNGVTLTVNSAAAVTTDPQPASVCVNSNTSFSINATGAPLNYQWQVSPDSITYSNISNNSNYFGANTGSLLVINVPASFNKRFYRCIVSGTGLCNIPDTSAGAVLTVNAIPSVSSSPVSVTKCAGDNAIFNVTGSGFGITYQWMESTDGGNSFNPISDGGIYSNATTSSLTLTGVSTLNNNNFYRCQISGACPSPVNSNPAKLTVNAIPAVSSLLTGNACSNVAQNYLITSTVPGTTFTWSRSAVPGISNTAVTNISSSTISETLINITNAPVFVTYVIKPVANTCSGADSSYVVNVDPTPVLPGVADISYCQGAAALPLTATPIVGGTLKWYPAATGGSGNSTAPTPSTSTAGNYFVSQIVNGCESNRAVIAVTLKTLPAAPVFSTPAPYCQNATASALSATPSASGILNWYGSTQTGTSSSTPTIPSTTTPGSVNYYVTQTVNGCEGPASIIPVRVNPIPSAPNVGGPYSYCQNSQSFPLTAGGSSGGTLNWYGTNATGGTASSTAPVPSTATNGLTKYYVSQTVNGCEGPRASIDINIISAVPTPVVVTPVRYCAHSVTNSLTATPDVGASLNWYANPTGGTAKSNAPTPSSALPGTTMFYVSQTQNGCESSRAAISVIIDSLPIVNAGADRTIDEGASVTLTAGGNADSYSWNKGISNGVAFTPTATESGYYTVTGVSSRNCQNKDSVLLFILRPNNPKIGVLYENLQYTSGGLVDFDSSVVLQGPFVYTFVISNQGYADLDITNISVQGGGSVFTIQQPNQTIVSPNTSTTFSVSFIPSDTGNVKATIVILNNDVDEGTFEINIQAYSKRIVPTLVFVPIADREYGSDDFVLTASSSNGKDITFTSLTPSIVTVNSNIASMINLGDASIQASIAGDSIYESVSVQQNFVVKFPVFGILGVDFLAEKIVNAYQIYPAKSKFIYRWSYSGQNIDFVKLDSTYQTAVAAGATTTSGTLSCKIYKEDGVTLLGEVGKPIKINHSPIAKTLDTLECSPAIGDVTDSYIRYVELENLKSESDFNNSGVSDFTQSGITTELFLGETYSGKVIVHGDLVYRAVGVWIDFDGSNSFDQDEYVFGDAIKDTVLELSNIRIPNVEENIGYRRMRIKVRDQVPFTYAQSCVESGEKGETEDYMISLKSRLDIQGAEIVTPNGDQKNDYFIVRGVNPRSTVRSLQVFDVTGKLVFSDDFYENDWDCRVAGTDNKNKLIPQGTYYYVFKTEVTEIKSFFEVIY